MNHSYASGCAYLVEQVQTGKNIDVTMEVDKHCYEIYVQVVDDDNEKFGTEAPYRRIIGDPFSYYQNKTISIPHTFHKSGVFKFGASSCAHTAT